MKNTKTNHKQVEEARNKKKNEIELKKKEKANVILQNYILKLRENITYRIKFRNDIPKQENEWDCGVFMLTFIKYTALNEEFNFETSHMKFLGNSSGKKLNRK